MESLTRSSGLVGLHGPTDDVFEKGFFCAVVVGHLSLVVEVDGAVLFECSLSRLKVFIQCRLYDPVSINPRTAGVSGRTRRAGGLNITPLVISGTKRRRETRRRRLKALNTNFLMHAYLFLK